MKWFNPTMDDFERTLEELESIIIDPEFKASLEEVYDINSLLLDQPVTEDEGFKILEDINAKWRKNGYHQRKIHVSGGIYIGGDPEYIEYPELEPTNLSDFTSKVLKSTEFMIRSVPRMQNDKLLVEQQVLLRGFGEVEDDEGVGGISIESCAVPLMPNTVIECREMTPQKAAAWLETYHQDTKLLIDQCIVQAEDEAEALINLRDTPLPPAEGSRKEVRELKKILQAYLTANVKFELYIPYRAVLFGAATVFDTVNLEWESKELMSVDKSLLTISTSSLKLNRETKEFEIWIEGNIITSKSDVTYVKLPIKTIESLESGRDIYRS